MIVLVNKWTKVGVWDLYFGEIFEPDVNRTRNLLIWSQTRYHCATDPSPQHGTENFYTKYLFGRDNIRSVVRSLGRQL